METLTQTTISLKEFKELLNVVNFPKTKEDISVYDGEVKFNNETSSYKGFDLSFDVEVRTNLSNRGNVIIDDISIDEVELWFNDSETMSLTEEMILELEKIAINQINLFV